MNVLIFSSLLLPASETFVKAQGEQLKHFTPYYVGSRYVPGLGLPEMRTFVVNQGDVFGKMRESLFKLSGYAPKLYRHLQQLHPVLIHAQFGLSGVLALPLKRALNIPLLVHFRGTDATEREEHSRYSSLNHWLYFNRQRDLKIETNLFLTVSSFIRDRLLEQGFPPEKVIVHYHGVDTSTFAPDRSVSRKPLVLFVGRLAEKKGCEYLIRAMAQVQSVLPEAELIIIGDGPLRYQLESQAAKQLQHYHFLGFQPPEVVRSWMNRARLLAAPSITGAWGESEGLPNVVMEAQAMALPVVGTHHAGIPEAVMHRETGFLVAERDIEGLVESMLLLLKNTDLWQNFSQRGRASMLSTFNRSRQSQVLEEIYEAVLRRNL